MHIPKDGTVLCFLLSLTIVPNAQMASVNPQVRTKAMADTKVTIVEIAAHFVTAIRLPEPANSVAVGERRTVSGGTFRARTGNRCW